MSQQELFFVIAAYFPGGTPNRPEGITSYLMRDFYRECLDLDDPCIFVAGTRAEADKKLAEFELMQAMLDTDVSDLEHHKVIRVHRDHLNQEAQVWPVPSGQ